MSNINGLQNGINHGKLNLIEEKLKGVISSHNGSDSERRSLEEIHDLIVKYSNEEDNMDYGISAISCYFPKTFVRQSELEKAQGISAGKYTIGLGQNEMGFCCDKEDIVSVTLTVTQKILDEYNIDPSSIGCLVVGTETLIDKSKSVKTELMKLFGDNTNIAGVDVKNACFGGTQAFFHAIDWMHHYYKKQKRYAIAVLADIAVYADGPARCTGGAGAIAVLVTPNAPLVLEDDLITYHMASTWDFFKPVGSHNCEYPVVAGKESVSSYMVSLEKCYNGYREQSIKIRGEDVSMADFSAAMFHSPFTKMVRKALARLVADDIRNQREVREEDIKAIEKIRSEPIDKDLSVISPSMISASEVTWRALTESNLEMNRRIGNMYTPSLFAQLLCYLSRYEYKSLSDRILLFAYGSGSASALFSIQLNSSYKDKLDRMIEISQSTINRLDDRIECTPNEYNDTMLQREKFYLSKVPTTPSSSSFPLFSGTFYLESIDSSYRRQYGRSMDQ